LILRWLKQPPLGGYILVGLALGSEGLGLVDYSDEISSLAEFGVILLLFIIGIELSVMAFLRVLQPAMIATLGQICCCILLALSVNAYFNWTLPHPCRPADRWRAGGAGYRGCADAGFCTIGHRCVAAMAIIAGAGGDCISDIGGVAGMDW
jgi:Kef-type K+ transport system membrane component KefB